MPNRDDTPFPPGVVDLDTDWQMLFARERVMLRSFSAVDVDLASDDETSDPDLERPSWSGVQAMTHVMAVQTGGGLSVVPVMYGGGYLLYEQAFPVQQRERLGPTARQVHDVRARVDEVHDEVGELREQVHMLRGEIADMRRLMESTVVAGGGLAEVLQAIVDSVAIDEDLDAQISPELAAILYPDGNRSADER